MPSVAAAGENTAFFINLKLTSGGKGYQPAAAG